MPYTPTAPTLVLCDDLVTQLRAAWGPKAPSEVRRAYLHRINLDDVKGRLVLFFPTAYDNRPAARGVDWYTHHITAVVFERYTDAADADETVLREWLDERVDFVHTQIVQGLEYGRDGTQPSFNRSLTTLSSDVTEICDFEKLEQNKEFWCAIEMVFQEQRDA